MANEEHLAILAQGVDVWNQWRADNKAIKPDLSRAILNLENLRQVNLSRVELYEADLSQTDLFQANLNGANLFDTNLSLANLFHADLSHANLSHADLSHADLNRAILNRADLNRAILRVTNLSQADLNQTNLHGANLSLANLNGANLFDSNMTEVELGWTVLGDVDLSTVKGLDTIKHSGPSTIGLDTIHRSKGQIAEQFLRDVGVPDNFITYMASLTSAAFEFYSCFISYASPDQSFAERLHADLQAKGVRCWFAPEDLKIGAKIRPTIDHSIRLHDKLLLVLSERALASAWVESEVEIALEEEQHRQQAGQTNPTILFPVRLDDAITHSTAAWAKAVKRTRHIGDFTQWKTHDAYQAAFTRLLRDLTKSEARSANP